MLNTLQRDDELITAMLAKLDRMLGMFEVSKTDSLKTAVQPNEVAGALTMHTDSLHGCSTTILGAREAKGGGLELEEAGDHVCGVHSILVLLVQGAMQVVATKLRERLLTIAKASAVINAGDVGLGEAASILSRDTFAPVVGHVGLEGNTSNVTIRVGGGVNTAGEDASNLLEVRC